MIRNIISMISMRPIEFAYFDEYDNKDVWIHIDRYGSEFIANLGYIPFLSIRIKIK